ncbi:hypothetical protein G6O69_31145 [Pseudenhygromyxa sp. WMMC2535]|uniref:hypothetical protein n=1 Tax=Pseudenhygromyxa sp. WMMC2535 TaxID=2712867 RepID=UPI001553FD11|nr:hypothetical protein [Pseudenhygromyxa sp. WMMC2535]NVB42320.1 hypothetical protein [Pseudenhygromyxa sp. WMMC2535]
MAKRDESDPKARQGEGSERTLEDVGDPPSVPPFDSAHPQPKTIHGVPTKDLQGAGGDLDDLFAVPSLGETTKVGLAPKGPPPLLPPVAPAPPVAGAKGPPKIPAPASVPAPAAKGPAPAAKGPAPAAKGPAPAAKGPAPTPAPAKTPEPETKPRVIIDEGLFDDEDEDEGAGETSQALPPPSSLLAKIRAAQSKGSEQSGSTPVDPAPKAEDPALGASALAPDSAPEPAPTEPAPTEPAPTEPAPTEPAPSEAAELSDADGSSHGADLSSGSPSEDDPREDEATLAFSRERAAKVIASTPPAPRAKSPMAPPPPSTTGASEDEEDEGRRIVPYVPPAVILRPDDPDEAPLPSQDTAISRVSQPRGLPRPGRLPQPARRDSPALSPSPQAASVVPQPSMAMRGRSEGAPVPVAPQDTASLISGLADELVAEVERENAPTVQVDLHQSRLAASAQAPEEAPTSRRKFVLIGVGAAALIALMAAFAIAKKGGGKDEVADAQPLVQAEPSDAAQPGPLAARDPQADAATGTETGVETGTETEAGAETETETETETGPEPSVAAKAPSPQPRPRNRASKSRSKSTSTATKPTTTTTTASKPEPKASTANLDADALYTKAESAYKKGSAGEAYKLASSSYNKKKRSKTAELMTLAACKLGSQGKAEASLKKVTLIRRNAIKKQCKSLGVKL